MPAPGQLILTHFLIPETTGFHFNRSREGWPLHITLVGWFDIPSDVREQFTTKLGQLAVAVDPVEVHVGPEEGFGPSKDIAVNVIVERTLMADIHKDLLSVVEDCGGKLENDRYARDNYRAHVTHHGAERCSEGDMLRFAGFSLVLLHEKDDCEVIANFSLRSSDEKAT